MLRPRLSIDCLRDALGGFEKWQETSRQRGHVSCIDEAVLTTRTILKDRATAARLRRGFSAAEQPRRVEAMARAACFSRRQFHRLMLQVLGETPGTHQRRLRLDRAAWLLSTSRATVLDVALETGFKRWKAGVYCLRVASSPGLSGKKVRRTDLRVLMNTQ